MESGLPKAGKFAILEENGEKVNGMKKFFAGLIAGAIMATAVSAGAASISPIGKRIDSTYKVTVDGKPLANPAIVVEGKSYIPASDAGTATGKIVSFNSKEGITLTSMPEPSATPTATPSPIGSTLLSDEEKEIRTLKDKVGRLEGEVMVLNVFIRDEVDQAKKAEYEKQKADKLKELDEAKAQLAALQSPSPTPTP